MTGLQFLIVVLINLTFVRSLNIGGSTTSINSKERLFELEGASFVVGTRTAKRRFLNASNKARSDLSQLAQEHKELTQKITVLKKPGHYNEAELKRLKRRKLLVKDLTNALRKRAKSGRKNREPSSASTTIGAGGFADVLLGHQVSTENDSGSGVKEPVAVKLSRRLEDAPLLLQEAQLIQQLNSRFDDGFVRVLHTETIPSGVAIVLDLLGPSLEDLWWACTCGVGGFSAWTTLQLAKDMLGLLEKLRRTGIAHRDIQPANILLGRQRDNNRLPHLIDFGIAKRIGPAPKATNGNNITTHAFSGTPRFASVSALCQHGGGSTAADDLESLCYTLAFLRTGEAPWPEHLEESASTTCGADALAQAKLAVSPQDLCSAGNSIVKRDDPAAKAIGELLEHARTATTNVNYGVCLKIVEQSILELEATMNGCSEFDWEQSQIHWSEQTGAVEHTLYSDDGDW